MYARNLKTGEIGDVNCISSSLVRVALWKNGKIARWKLGRSNIELIEFGSFNPNNKNYQEGGRKIRID
jgi:hypothetical protein